VARAEAHLHAKFHLHPSNRLATIHQRHRPDRQLSDSIRRLFYKRSPKNWVKQHKLKRAIQGHNKYFRRNVAVICCSRIKEKTQSDPEIVHNTLKARYYEQDILDLLTITVVIYTTDTILSSGNWPILTFENVNNGHNIKQIKWNNLLLAPLPVICIINIRHCQTYVPQGIMGNTPFPSDIRIEIEMATSLYVSPADLPAMNIHKCQRRTGRAFCMPVLMNIHTHDAMNGMLSPITCSTCI